MKNRLYLLAFLLFNAFFAHAQKTPADNFTLRGTIYHSHTNKLWLRYPDSTGNVVNRLIHVKNGKFIFKAFLISPVYAGLVISPELHIEGTPGFAELFLNPGNMTITMYEGHFNEAKITGESEMRNEWEQLMKQKKPLQDAKYSLYEKQWKISAGGNTPKNHAAAIINGDKIDVYSYREKQMDYNFILSHHT